MLYINKDKVILDPTYGVADGNGFIIYNPTPEKMKELGYEEYKAPEPTEKLKIADEIDALRTQLYRTDYIPLKAIEGYPCDEIYPNWRTDRLQWRDRINYLLSKL